MGFASESSQPGLMTPTRTPGEEFCFRSKAFPAQSVLTTLEFAAEVVMHASSPAGNLQKAPLPRTRIPSVPLRVVVPDLSR